MCFCPLSLDVAVSLSLIGGEIEVSRGKRGCLSTRALSNGTVLKLNAAGLASGTSAGDARKPHPVALRSTSATRYEAGQSPRDCPDDHADDPEAESVGDACARDVSTH